MLSVTLVSQCGNSCHPSTSLHHRMLINALLLHKPMVDQVEAQSVQACSSLISSLISKDNNCLSLSVYAEGCFEKQN
ncbi:hypothetical protein GW17_00013479 [Ensete ventricosum]|nr:hypothetical protein GW17_00013479 [Ensete ventricosum]